jgi:uncharacterized protein (DUF3084 family)
MKTFLQLAGVFALVSIGCFFLRLSYSLKAITVTTNDSLRAIAKDADDVRVMLNAAGFQAEETLHHTDEILEVERSAQKQQLAKTQQALDQLTLTLQHLDRSTADALQPVGPLLQQTQDTLAKTGGLENQLQQNLVLMQPAIQNVNRLTANLDQTSADIEHEVHKLVYPPPRKWYQKYLLDPAKTAAHLISIPVTSF